MGFWSCVKYLAGTGAAGFALGRILPKDWFFHNRFPYKEYLCEHGGRIYEKLRIKAWQNRVPDMSRILPSLVPPKQFGRGDTHRLPSMIQETCVAELVHGLLCLSGLVCLKLWPGMGGAVITLLNLVVNLAYKELIRAVIELTLGILLLLDARASLQHHIILLGVELLLVGWRILQDAKLLRQQEDIV